MYNVHPDRYAKLFLDIDLYRDLLQEFLLFLIQNPLQAIH